MTADVQQFQVDLRGVVDLLSRHIYSSPRVYLRELLQNARDAITARHEVDGGGGRIRITPLTAENGEFVLRDDGVGLTLTEVADLLKIALNAPTAECHCVVVDAKGIAIYVAEIIYRGDCVKLYIDLLQNGRGNRSGRRT